MTSAGLCDIAYSLRYKTWLLGIAARKSLKPLLDIGVVSQTIFYFILFYFILFHFHFIGQLN